MTNNVFAHAGLMHFFFFFYKIEIIDHANHDQSSPIMAIFDQFFIIIDHLHNTNLHCRRGPSPCLSVAAWCRDTCVLWPT